MLPLHHAGVSPTEVEPPYRGSDEPTHKDLSDRRVPISPLRRIAFFSAIRCFFQKISLPVAQVFPPLRGRNEHAFSHVCHWLASMDSNHDPLSQSQASYR